MKIEVKLFPLGAKASDGSVIPLSAASQYLTSKSYRDSIESKTAFIGMTHKDRVRDENLTSIGQNDRQLVNKNTLGYISRIWIKGDFLWAEANIFDPKNFKGDAQHNIAFLRGLLTEGVVPPISGVVDAHWDKSEMAKEIVKIIGFDFTLDPAFAGAGVENVTL